MCYVHIDTYMYMIHFVYKQTLSGQLSVFFLLLSLYYFPILNFISCVKTVTVTGFCRSFQLSCERLYHCTPIYVDLLKSIIIVAGLTQAANKPTIIIRKSSKNVPFRKTLIVVKEWYQLGSENCLIFF